MIKITQKLIHYFINNEDNGLILEGEVKLTELNEINSFVGHFRTESTNYLGSFAYYETSSTFTKNMVEIDKNILKEAENLLDSTILEIKQ